MIYCLVHECPFCNFIQKNNILHYQWGTFKYFRKKERGGKSVKSVKCGVARKRSENSALALRELFESANSESATRNEKALAQ